MNINATVHLPDGHAKSTIADRLQEMEFAVIDEQQANQGVPSRLRVYNAKRRLRRLLRRMGGPGVHGTAWRITGCGGSYTLNIE